MTTWKVMGSIHYSEGYDYKASYFLLDDTLDQFFSVKEFHSMLMLDCYKFLVNLIMDTLRALALAAEKPTMELMDKPPQCRVFNLKSSLLHSRPKSIVGTPAYIAPEGLLGGSMMAGDKNQIIEKMCALQELIPNCNKVDFFFLTFAEYT